MVKKMERFFEEKISRRDFFKKSGLFLAGLGGSWHLINLLTKNKIPRSDEEGGMQYRILGRTNLRVSVVGFGGVPIWRRVGEKAAIRVINHSLDLGINFIDTARMYGPSEIRIGKVMAERREECYLATKVVRRSYGEALEDVEISLSNLQTDYIDLYQIHSVDDAATFKRVMARDGSLRALKEKKKEGKIGFIGISGHVPELLMEAIKTGEFDTVQAIYNLANLEASRKLFPLAKKENIGVIVMKPLAGGLLTMPPLKKIMAELKDEYKALIEELKGWAYLTPAMAAIKFALDNEAISTVIPGMGSLRNVEESVAVGRVRAPLPEPLKRKLVAQVYKLAEGLCRFCGYCLPCPQGINIPEVFRLEVYYTRYGLKEWAREQYARLPVKVEACNGCGVCLPRCPFHIPIIKDLKRAARVLGGN